MQFLSQNIPTIYSENSRVKPLNFLPYNKVAQMELNRVYRWESFNQKHFESRFTRFYEGTLPTVGFIREVQLSSLILTGQTAGQRLEELKKNLTISIRLTMTSTTLRINWTLRLKSSRAIIRFHINFTQTILMVDL